MSETEAPCRILVLDDDPYMLDVFKLIGDSLPDCSLHTAINLRKARKIVEAAPIDLVCLDLVMPENSGFDVLAELKHHPHTAAAYFILMSAEKQQLLDRMRSYQLEAQDFLSKPFDIHELELKLRSKIKYLQNLKAAARVATQQAVPAPAAAGPAKTGIRELGRFTLNPDLRRICYDGQELALTPSEYRLMHYLLAHPETVLTTEQIIETVWEQKIDTSTSTDLNVRSLVHKVRHKIEPDPAKPIHLVNSRSNGYVFYPGT